MSDKKALNDFFAKQKKTKKPAAAPAKQEEVAKTEQVENKQAAQ